MGYNFSFLFEKVSENYQVCYAILLIYIAFEFTFVLNHLMVKYQLFEYVRPFCEVGDYRVKQIFCVPKKS